jgi:hypothetical protein
LAENSKILKGERAAQVIGESTIDIKEFAKDLMTKK